MGMGMVISLRVGSSDWVKVTKFNSMLFIKDVIFHIKVQKD